MSSAKKQQHDSRLIEMNNLLKNGEPSLPRMRELYHQISPKYLSKGNMPKYVNITDYLRLRDEGKDHIVAYQSSFIKLEENATRHLSGSKAAKRSTQQRLKDKAMVGELKAIKEKQYAMADAMGLDRAMVDLVTDMFIKQQEFRPSFMASMKEAGFGGGAGGGSTRSIKDH